MSLISTSYPGARQKRRKSIGILNLIFIEGLMKFHRKNKPSSTTKFLLKTIPQVSAADALFVKVKRAMERCRGGFSGGQRR